MGQTVRVAFLLIYSFAATISWAGDWVRDRVFAINCGMYPRGGAETLGEDLENALDQGHGCLQALPSRKHRLVAVQLENLFKYETYPHGLITCSDLNDSKRGPTDSSGVLDRVYAPQPNESNKKRLSPFAKAVRDKISLDLSNADLDSEEKAKAILFEKIMGNWLYHHHSLSRDEIYLSGLCCFPSGISIYTGLNRIDGRKTEEVAQKLACQLLNKNPRSEEFQTELTYLRAIHLGHADDSIQANWNALFLDPGQEINGHLFHVILEVISAQEPIFASVLQMALFDFLPKWSDDERAQAFRISFRRALGKAENIKARETYILVLSNIVRAIIANSDEDSFRKQKDLLLFVQKYNSVFNRQEREEVTKLIRLTQERLLIMEVAKKVELDRIWNANLFFAK